uniref:Uncharacterized protein n=1 Tax=Oncorhynchus tshawytscha TaxID=74940 RepID=A0A8C8M9L1_ONCTS
PGAHCTWPNPRLTLSSRRGGGMMPGNPLSKQQEPEQDVAPLSVQIANVVVPLWNVPYDEQRRRKKQEVEGVLQRLVRYRDILSATNKGFDNLGSSQNTCTDCTPCLGLHNVDPNTLSPTLIMQTEYRNKCEFVIGIGANGEDDKTIGFRLWKYKGGSCAVVGPSDCIHVATKAKKVVCEFQKCIRTTPYSVYRPEAYEVRWKSQTVQTTTRTKQAMAVFFNPQLQKSGFKVVNTKIMFGSRRQSPNPEDMTCDLVAGEECIHEELLGLEFRISPYYFFQVSIPWLINIESHCGKAAEDISNGAQHCHIPKRHSHCGPTQSKPTYAQKDTGASLPHILSVCNALYSIVILAIRAAMNKFIDLCRAPSNGVRGAHFHPVRAMALQIMPVSVHHPKGYLMYAF